MAEDINLLPQQAEENTSQKKQQRLLSIISAVILVITIVAVVGLFIGKTVIQSQISAVDKDIDVQHQRIEAKAQDEIIERSLANKITALQTFFSTQHHYSAFLNALTKTMPDSVKLTDLNVDEKQQATISGTTASYPDLAGFYDALSQAGSTDGKTGTYFLNPVLTAISRNGQSGVINFSMQFTVGKPALAASGG